MKLTVKTLQQKAIQLEVDPSENVLHVKQKLNQSEGFPIESQKLIYSGKVLTDDQSLESLNIKESEFMVVMVTKSKPAATTATTTTPAPSTSATTSTTPSATTATTTTTTTPAPLPSVPAQTPSSTPAAPAPVSAPSDPSFVTGAAYETAVANMIEIGFPRDQVVHAMRLAFNNPDRAVNYLMNGIPEGLEPLSSTPSETGTSSTTAAAPSSLPAATPQAATTPSSTTATTTTTTPSSSSSSSSSSSAAAATTTQNLFNLAQLQQQQQQAGSHPYSQLSPTAPTSPTSDLSELAQNPQFDQLRQLVQTNPQLLQPILQQMTQNNPQLMELISTHQDEFFQLLLNPSSYQPGGGPDEDTLTIQITEEEKCAIDRLVALGFDRHIAIEAYFACDKNEEMAANYLFENQFD